ncbi:TetR/AcrR family transcriptional regulator [Streptomyces sp. 8L]|uniref:TetR/AcrR family transcriptional regulator n=1 Tax=unclassified Streptomyces TaxID=2593676 RepID=UPI001CD1A7FF|nr:TetR/AcrR family transcriptional regulator [Streptomyces sp. 8L]MCA1220913.1 TetR/AcrR family transcriptional regulator [Streptomyces sp. 8L]
MPRVTQEHRDARRRQILAAAREVFAVKGFAQTSTGEIVAASGLSTGAVYSYFPSKNDLVAAVCEDAVDSVVDPVSIRDAAELLDRVRARHGGHARLMAQVWAEAAVNPGLAAQIRERLDKDQEKAAGLIRQDRRARGLPDAPDAHGVAGALLAMLTGYSQRLAIGQDTDTAAFRQALQSLLGDAA